MKIINIIWHSMTGGSKALAQAAYDGAQVAGEQAVKARLLHADDVTVQAMLEADGYIFAFPENLAAISGVMKACFDRLYYPCLGRIEGRPYALIICAGSDGSNALRQAERIATGWRLKQMADSQITCTHAQTPEQILAPKTIDAVELAKAEKTGGAMAAGLAMGIF
ncbi:flavodoxin family protein [Sphingorhabdus arenilitoris]|uniref:Flavodoxin family protein n=1 Tax=Sphingorhabdus arenilitoris TaxID=1490041 RepID=A0ABV8RE61_9SPHN